MRGAGLRYSVLQFCNYLTRILYKHNLLSVAPIRTSINNLIMFLKADTGASKNFVRDTDALMLKKVHAILNGPIAKLPNNDVIKAHKQGFLPFSDKLSDKAKSALIYPALRMLLYFQLGNCVMTIE